MTTSKPDVQRYEDTGCPEQICRVDTMRESADGDYVLYDDYKALQAECEALREALEDISGTHHHSASAGEYFAKVARKALAAHRKQGGSND